MKRKIIQIEVDNFLDPTAGQYCGLIALCDDGTLWSGQVTAGGASWEMMDTSIITDSDSNHA